MIIGRSPVRISLGGGGTDLPSYYEQYGGEVLNVAINKYFYTVANERRDGRVQIISSDLRVFESWCNLPAVNGRGGPLEIPIAVLKEMGPDLSLDLFLASEIPPGTGLGSSASVCVNILQVVSTCMGQALTKQELAERAFAVARGNLGRHVGKQDEYAAAFGGINHIRFAKDGATSVEPLEIDRTVVAELQSNLMLFFTGSAHNSWDVLAKQEQAVRTHSGGTVDALHEIRKLAGEMKTALLAGELRTFGECLHQSWQAKKRVTQFVSTEWIDRLYSLARTNGAMGGKITGAGGGGFLLIYCEPENQAAVREALEGEGVSEMHFGFDYQGAQIVVNDRLLDGDGEGRPSRLMSAAFAGVPGPSSNAGDAG